MGCFSAIILMASFVLAVATLIRWFEQTTEAVDRREWGHVLRLVVMPLAVWLYPSRVSAGRPTAVPHHEPVRGFGSLPKSPSPTDQPPPGTPREFLELPKVTAAKPPSGVDPEKIAKLKEKMRQQGMLPPDGD